MANSNLTVKPDRTAAERASYRARKRALVTVTQRDAAPVTEADRGPRNGLPPRLHVPWSAVLLVCIALAIAALALESTGRRGGGSVRRPWQP